MSDELSLEDKLAKIIGGGIFNSLTVGEMVDKIIPLVRESERQRCIGVAEGMKLDLSKSLDLPHPDHDNTDYDVDSRWTITRKGWDFLQDRIGIPERVLTLQGEVIGVSVGLCRLRNLADSSTWQKFDFIKHCLAISEKEVHQQRTHYGYWYETSSSN